MRRMPPRKITNRQRRKGYIKVVKGENAYRIAFADGCIIEAGQIGTEPLGESTKSIIISHNEIS